MNILDENVPESQHGLLRRRRVPIKQIGRDIARKGMKDNEIIPLLHQMDRPTFFTLDGRFLRSAIVSSAYCLVYLDIDEEMVAERICRFLRHSAMNSRAKRMGHVIRVSTAGMHAWRLHEKREILLSWQ